MENFDRQKLFDLAKNDAPPLTRDEAAKLVNTFQAPVGKAKKPKKGIILFSLVALLGISGVAFGYFISRNDKNEDITEAQAEITTAPAEKQNQFNKEINTLNTAHTAEKPANTNGDSIRQKKNNSGKPQMKEKEGIIKVSDKNGPAKTGDKKTKDVAKTDNKTGENIPYQQLIAAQSENTTDTVEETGTIKVSVKDSLGDYNLSDEEIAKKEKLLPDRVAGDYHRPTYIKTDLYGLFYGPTTYLHGDLPMRRISLSLEKMITGRVSVGGQLSLGNSRYFYGVGSSGYVDSGASHYTVDDDRVTVWKGWTASAEGRYYFEPRGLGPFAGASLTFADFKEETFYRYYKNGNKVPFTSVQSSKLSIYGVGLVAGYKAVFWQRFMVEALVGFSGAYNNGKTNLFINESYRRRTLSRYELNIGWKF